jgi:hypothetical protein
MAERGAGVVVTEEMLIGAAKTGAHETLAVWARQGVRVTSAVPLFLAARGRHLLALQCLVRELGANVNQTFQGETPLMSAAYERKPAVVRCLLELGADVNQASGKTFYAEGRTALHTAAHIGGLASVRYLIQAGAKIGAVDSTGETALLESAQGGHYAAMQYLLEEAGANMDDINNFGETAWDLLREHLERMADDQDYFAEVEADPEVEPLALTSLLRVMVLRSAPPPALVALLSPEDTDMVQEGARLRARLPAYLAHRRAYLDLRCPRISLLPGVLRALIYTFEGPATTEELWATGLGSAP